jgi:23S rRNA pseudouridine1911/1915/1917 synthase
VSATEGPITVPTALDGTRIDRVVALLTGLSRARVRELLASGAVQLGGRPETDASRRVTAGSLLELPPAAAVAAPDAGKHPPAPDRTVAVEVVHEDAALLVIDKPAGLVVHPGPGHRDGTLVAGLLARYPDIAGAGAPDRPGIVHRLDKDTSGLLVVARTPEAYAALTGQLADRTMGREYLAVVAGDVVAGEGVVDAPLKRSVRDRTRVAVAAPGEGRTARTHYSVRRRYTSPIALTELLVRLETGRTHQIRAHLSAIGHPVLGDATYHGRRREVPLARPFLHAWQLHLVHPTTGSPVSWSSPLPAELEAVLETFS